MKTNNKGITLSETLCYVIVFSLLITVLTGYLIYVNKFNKNNNQEELKEITFLETITNNITDQKIINSENLYIYISNEEEIELRGIGTDDIYFNYNFETNEMFNGISGRSITFNILNIEVEDKGDYLYIFNDTKNYHYIIEV